MGTRLMFSIAARDDAVVLARHHAHGGEVGGLLPGAAHAVERGAADVEREAGDERRVPRDVQSLLAQLVDAADDHVLDFGRIDLGPLDQRLQRIGQQVVRPDRGELAVALADGGACRPDDHRIVHGCLHWAM